MTVIVSAVILSDMHCDCSGKQSGQGAVRGTGCCSVRMCAVCWHSGFGPSSPLVRPSYTVDDLLTLEDDELQGAQVILVFGISILTNGPLQFMDHTVHLVSYTLVTTNHMEI